MATKLLKELFRNNYKKAIMDTIISGFFLADFKSIESIANEIARDNSNATAQGYLYKGRVYPEHIKDNVPILHESYHAKAEKLHVHMTHIIEAKTIISTYLRKLLIQCETAGDILKLLCPELISGIPFNVLERLDESPALLTDDDVTKFNEKNSEYLAEVKAYLFYKELFYKE